MSVLPDTVVVIQLFFNEQFNATAVVIYIFVVKDRQFVSICHVNITQIHTNIPFEIPHQSYNKETNYLMKANNICILKYLIFVHTLLLCL